jgi:hypothetical protein
MTSAYTIQKGDIILMHPNSKWANVGTYGTINYTVGTGMTSGIFNFHPGESIEKDIQKTVYVIRKPGIPVGYEIGLTEYDFKITTTMKVPDDTHRSLKDLYILSNQSKTALNSDSQMVALGATVGSSCNGRCLFYYRGDTVLNYSPNWASPNILYPVIIKNVWWSQQEGRGTMFDVRVQLSHVS